MTERGPVERDLEFAEAIESSAVQNSVAAGGLGALVMIPVARVMTWISGSIRKARASRRA